MSRIVETDLGKIEIDTCTSETIAGCWVALGWTLPKHGMCKAVIAETPEAEVMTATIRELYGKDFTLCNQEVFRPFKPSP